MKGKRVLKYLIESARRNKTVDLEWITEACRRLLRRSGADEEARSMVVKIVEEVEEEFRQRVDKWRAEGFDYLDELWPLYDRLLTAVELLVERPDKVAAQRLCHTLRKMWLEAEEIAVKHLFGL